MKLEIVSAGPLTTVQDAGRGGYAASGFQESGVCDKLSYALCNLLAGNDPKDGCAVLEFTLKGPTIRFDGAGIIALGGAGMDARLNDKPAPPYTPLAVRGGDTLAIGMAQTGLRGYLAVWGGLDVPVVMGSRATNLKCKTGGFEGRALKEGDVLQTGAKGPVLPKMATLSRAWQRLCRQETPELLWLLHPTHPQRFCGGRSVAVLRAVAGPQQAAFTPAGLATFEKATYTLTPDSNRMACKLNGPVIETKNGADILSDGIVEGSVQVAANGQPIVMLADHQTTGGYAKIATVITADLPLLAQCRPGDQVGFRFITPEEAVETIRGQHKALLWLKERL